MKRMRRSPSVISSVSGRDRGGSKRLIDRMEVDVERDRSGGRHNRRDNHDDDVSFSLLFHIMSPQVRHQRSSKSKQDLTKIESELREKALRQKVVRTRDQKDY